MAKLFDLCTMLSSNDLQGHCLPPEKLWMRLQINLSLKKYTMLLYGLILGYILWLWYNVYTLNSQSMWLKEKGAVAIEKLNACLSVRETERCCSVHCQTMCIVYCTVIHALTLTHWKYRLLWWISKFPKKLICQNWLFKIC